jgi:hypothetical protein
MRVAARFGLSWDGQKGWTAADYPRPQLSGRTTPADRKRDHDAATAWENDTRARVNVAAGDWQHCLKAGDDGPGTPPIAEKDPNAILAGTWYLHRDSPDPFAGTGSACPLAETLTIEFKDGSANIATVTFAGKQPEKAKGVGPGQFEHEEGNTQNGLRFEVGLIVYDQKDAISGQFHDNGGNYLCTVGFTGLKSPWPNP